MNTPENVQRAATQLAGLPNDLATVEQLGSTVWNALVELGWTPPGISKAQPGELQAAHDAGYAEAQTEAQFQIEQAYLRGQRDSDSPRTLTYATPDIDATPSPDDWTWMPLRWRHVRPDDVFINDDRPWMVLRSGAHGNALGWSVDVASNEGRFVGVEVDPDEVISVLCPVPEANALARVRDELGGTVVDRNV